jgi:hypothetical protein
MSFPKQILILALFLTLSLAVFPVKAQEEGGVSEIANPALFASLQAKLNQIFLELSNLQQMLAQISASTQLRYTLSLEKIGDGTGTVYSSPPGIKCGPQCSFASMDFPANKVVTLRRIPSSDSTFVEWSGDCDIKSSLLCKVKMNSNKSVTARFDKKKKLEVWKAGQGFGRIISSKPKGVIDCGSVCSNVFDYNAKVVLQAIPATGYVFSSWSGCDNVSGSSCTVIMNDNREVTAYFEPQSYETFRVTVQIFGGANIRRVFSVPQDRPRGLDCDVNVQDCSGDFYKGIDVQIIAESWVTGLDWTGCDKITDFGKVCNIYGINRDRAIYVTFR